MGYPKILDSLAFTYKISDNVTVAQSCLVGFSMPPHYSYTVIETGEHFSGNTGNAKEDYALWKARQWMHASKDWFKMNTPKTSPSSPLTLQKLVEQRQEEPMDQS